ncbi:hypothetical protein N7G274_003152 [Stereocaulon virgatum]|uniref:BTB domain-containing protein n=1 Tax=Stereocaulon virgatum TaxID=373712 RepID=A0ABR4AIH8_9LECA
MSLKADKKPSRITRESFDEVVEVKVGPKATVFQIHKGLLCKAAPYFKVAFEGQFKEAEEQVLECNDEDVTMFKHFQYWLYTNNIIDESETVKEMTWQSIVSLYIFAEVRDIPDLQNAAMDIMINKVSLEHRIPAREFHQIYEQTDENSPLRRIAIDWLAHLGRLVPAEWLVEFDKDTFPKEALVDLVFAQYELRVGTRALIKDFGALRSDYHIKPPGAAV